MDKEFVVSKKEELLLLALAALRISPYLLVIILCMFATSPLREIAWLNAGFIVTAFMAKTPLLHTTKYIITDKGITQVLKSGFSVSGEWDRLIKCEIETRVVPNCKLFFDNAPIITINLDGQFRGVLIRLCMSASGAKSPLSAEFMKSKNQRFLQDKHRRCKLK